jgi:RNA polymerase sigma-70 factor (ECF subfamily)
MREASTFDEFYADGGHRLVAQIYVMIGDRAEAEDAVAEAYARAWQRWNTIANCDNPTGWVRTVAFRIAVSSWRRAVNRRTAHRRFGQARSGPAEPSPDTVAIVAALRRLPAAQRRAIVLHHVGGLTVSQIALETNASPSAVKARLSRGRRALATLLSDDLEKPCSTT